MKDLIDNKEENGEIVAVASESHPSETEPQAPPPEEEEKIDPEPQRKNGIRNFPYIVKTAVRYPLALAIIFFVLYMAGSMYIPGVPDPLLFLLLRLLRYSGFLLIVFSLVALGFGVHRLVYKPCTRTVLSTLLYFFLILLGAVFIMFSLLIVEMSAGV